MSDKAEAEKAEPKKKSKKMLIIVVAAVVVLGGGGAGAYFMFLAKPSKPAPPVAGKVVPLDAVTMNLAEGHFLKLKISLQATATAKEDPDGSKALDIAIDQFSNRTVAELSSNAARDQAKAELRKSVSKAYDGDVMDVYFTEFVMQ